MTKVEWRANGGQVPWGYKGPVLMRDTGNNTVLTTMGARFPVSDCKRLWKVIQSAVQANQRLDIAKRYKMGNYPIDYIDANGDVKAGCHFVTFAECRRLAVSLGLEKATIRERASMLAERLAA